MESREGLPQAVIYAGLKLVKAPSASAFCAPLQGASPQLYLALSQPHQIIALWQDGVDAADDLPSRRH